MSRRTLLAVSIALSLVMHTTIIAVAPRVPVMRIYGPSAELMHSFKVRLHDSLPEVDDSLSRALTRELATRPGSMDELIKREPETLRPDSTLERAVEVPQLADRVASEPIIREHDLDMSDQVLRKVDAKIVEISQDVARQDIQIARRLVRPSPMRILGEDESPALRVAGEDMPEKLLTIDPLRAGSGSGTDIGPPGPPAPGSGLPEREEGVLGPDSIESAPPSLPTLPDEKTIAQRPALAEAREEAPYEFMDDLVDMTIETFVPPGATEGYFRLKIAPRKGSSIEVLPKDITFVIDASRSIQQRKLDQAVRGLQAAIAALRPEDRFNIIIFRDTPTAFRESYVEATPDTKAAAASFVSGLQSRGTTDIYQALSPVVLTEPRQGAAGLVVVVTDGMPTAGVTNGRAIINALTDRNEQRKTVLAFGGGRAINHYLLDLLAYRNRGESFVADDIASVGQDFSQFVNVFSDPVLIGCRADYGRIDENSVFPQELPDFFLGQGVTVYGRFAPERDRNFAMRLSGAAGDRKKEVIFKANLEEAATGDEAIAREWAFRKVYHLIGEICRVGERPELLEELRSLSRQYGIRTSYDG